MYKQKPGALRQMKTGAGIPLSMKSAAYQKDPNSARTILREKTMQKKEDRVLDSLASIKKRGEFQTAKLYNNKNRENIFGNASTQSSNSRLGTGLTVENQSTTKEFQSTQDARTLAGGIVPGSGRKKAATLPPAKGTPKKRAGGGTVGTSEYEEAAQKLKEDFRKAKPVAKQMKKGGPKQQTRKDKLDEKLGVKDGAEKSKSQSMRDRRDESAAMQMKPKKKGGMKQMDKKAPAKQTASQKAKLPAKLVAAIKAKGPKQKMKAGMKQMDKKGGPKEYGKGPKQKESVKQEKIDLKENVLAKDMTKGR